MEIRKIICKQRVLEYQLTRKQVKNINLRIKPDGKIFVSANKRVPAEYIDEFIRRKQDFIIQALEKCEENRKHDTIAPRQYVSGERFYVLGKCLQLKVIEGNPESVSVDGELLVLVVNNKDNLRRKEKLVLNWLRQLQIETFHEIVNEVYQIFKQYGIAYPQIKIRSMTSRWGSCQPQKGIITLNSKLIEAPRTSIEYVVLHEFAHFIHPNHSKNFYDFVALFMPDWKERKKGLERRGHD